MHFLRLLSRDGAAAAATAAATGSSSSISLGVIIAIVVVGTLVIAAGGGLTCAWISRRNRRQRRQTIVQQEEELRQKEMMAVSMLRDDNTHNLVPTLGANGPAAAAAKNPASGPVAYTALSDCGSSTCCSLASSFNTADYEGSGIAWWWRYRWRQMRSGSNIKKGPGNFGSGSGHNCPHGHDNRSHHRRQNGDRTGPRKLQRRRPETNIIASTNSLFFPSFGETNHNDVNNLSNTQLNMMHVPGGDSMNHHNNYKHPERPPPPADHQRLISNGMTMTSQSNQNMNMRYYQQQQRQRQQPLPVSLQPEPQTTSRSLPRPPQPALIIPDRPHSQNAQNATNMQNPQNMQQIQSMQNVPVQYQLTDQQRHMLMVQQQHLQQQMAYYQRQINLQQQHNQQLMQEQQRRGSKPLPHNFATDSALSEILRSTEKRLQQLQAGPLRGLQMTQENVDSTEMEKRQSVVTIESSNDEAESPILDAIPTPLSSPSKSPRKISGAGLGVHTGITAPVYSLPPPAKSTATNSSPDTHSSVYSSSPASPASSRSSSLSTVYSADEREALASITDGPFASKGMAGLGITGANIPEDHSSDKNDKTIASRRSRRMSLSVNTNINVHNVHIPDPPPRSPKRSPHRSAIVSSSMVMMGGGISIPHRNIQNNTLSQGSPTKRNTGIIMNNSGIRSSFGPNRYIEAAGTSSSDESDNQKEDDDLLPRHSPPHIQRPRAEPAAARQSRQEPSDALQAVEAEQALFRQSVKALPKPQNVPQLTVGNLAAGHRATVVTIAADLRRMNSTAYSEASSCYSNATTATSVVSGQPDTLSAQRNSARLSGTGGGRGHRQRNSTNSTGTTTAADAGQRASIGSRQYLALGTKHMSMMAPEKDTSLGQAPSQQRMSYDALTTLAQAAAASNAPPVSAPRRARSTRAMTIATTGTTLLRVDENPASNTSTPRNTPKKAPAASSNNTPTANMGKPLTKSPSKGAFVGSVEPKSKTLAPGTGLTTPSKSGKGLMGPRQPGSGGKGSKRDSLGLYDQDGFLMSSPFREK